MIEVLNDFSVESWLRRKSIVTLRCSSKVSLAVCTLDVGTFVTKLLLNAVHFVNDVCSSIYIDLSLG
jgi:hypothetical protein